MIKKFINLTSNLLDLCKLKVVSLILLTAVVGMFLELYVYRSLGVPVVSTPVANTEDLIDDIRIAGPSTFVAELDAAIAERRRCGRTFPDSVIMRRYAWDTRLRAIMEHAGQALSAKLARQYGEQAHRS